MFDGLKVLTNWGPLLAVALALVFGIGIYDKHQQGIGEARTQGKWDAQQLAQQKQTVRLLEARDAQNARLVDEAQQEREIKNAQIDQLNTDVADLAERLRKRSKRASAVGVPQNSATGAGPSCTGAELYQEDGLAFAGEAARADRIRLDLVECQARYKEARVACNALK